MRKSLLLSVAVAAMVVQTAASTAAEVRDVGQLAVPATTLPQGDGAAFASSVVGALGIDADSSLVQAKAIPLPNGQGRSIRLNQHFRGVPIWGQQVVVQQASDGRLLGASGTAVFDIDAAREPPAVPRLGVADAIEVGRATVRRAPYALNLENEKADLVYYPQGSALRLVYKVSFFAFLPDGKGGHKATSPMIFVDAESGAVVHSYENLHTDRLGTGPGGNNKTGQYNYGTGVFPKFEVTQPGGGVCGMDGPNVVSQNWNHSNSTSGSGTTFTFPCFNNTFKSINGAFSPINDAHSFGQVVFDHFKEWYNTAPLTYKLIMRVHVSSGYENAFFLNQAMWFGDGLNEFYPLVSLDVVSHEISHGVTEQNSDLIYDNQSGGINEAFSDMAGEASEFYFLSKYGGAFGRTSPDLLTGADIYKAPGQALRYMCNPTQDGVSIDHVNQYNDNVDVHYSSGIYNKVFCLLSQRPGWTVRKAFDVFMVANQHYWTPSTTFVSGANGALRAAQLLGYPLADVSAAFAPVGINLPILTAGPAVSAFSGKSGKAFAPGSVAVSLKSSMGSLSWSVTGLPSWLIASPATGTTTTTGTTMALIPGPAIKALKKSTVAVIFFNNLTTSGQAPIPHLVTVTVKKAKKKKRKDADVELSVVTAR